MSVVSASFEVGCGANRYLKGHTPCCGGSALSATLTTTFTSTTVRQVMRKRMMLTVLATAVGLMAGNVAFAADNELDRGDRRFLQRAAQAGQFEIEASKLAT